MNLKKLYPFDQGWIHGQYQLTTSQQFDEEHLKKIVTLGKPEEYEIPFIEQSGRNVIAVTRHNSRKPAKA